MGHGGCTVEEDEEVRMFGDLRRGSMSGYWCIRRADGGGIEGSFVDGLRNGPGHETDKDGLEYLGSYHNDQRSQTGRLSMPDGSVYVGEWKHNQKHGIGLETVNEEDQYFGEWVSGEKHGLGYELKSGREYKGYFKNGKPHGLAVVKLPNTSKTYARF